MWIEFDGMRARGLMDIAGLTGKNPVFTAKFTEYLPEIKEHMYYILNHEDEDTVCLIGHLYLFLHALIRSVNEKGYRPQRNKLVDFYMREATAFIDNNYEKDISVQDIARNCGLDRSYFGKIFKEAMGYTPQEFLLSFRISKAQDLLKNSPMSVGEISHAVGYENQLHFSRAFAKFCGMSPTAWRKSNVR
jgi:AraC-like DNA-binding protein